jgi:hypothetical protein
MKKYIVTTLIFLALIFSAYFFYRSTIQTEQEKTEISFKAEIYLQAVILSDNLWYLFNDYVSGVERIKFYLGEKGKVPTAADLKRFYDNVNKAKFNLINIAFVDSGGTCISIYPEKYSVEKGINYSFRNYFKEAQKTDKVVISKSSINYRPHNKALKYRAVTIIAPVKDLENKNLGYILADIDVFDLEKFNQYKFLAQNGKISFYIIDTDGNEILSSPQISGWHKLSTTNKDFRSFIINYPKTHNENKCISAKVSGEKAFFASSPLKIGDNSLAVVAMLPYKGSIMSTTDFFSRLSVIMSFTTLIVFFLFGFVLYHGVIVKKLKKKISRLEIVIDDKLKKQDMEDIAQTEYFKELQDKIKSIKKV